MLPFEVISYSFDNFKQSLIKKSFNNSELISEKRQLKYFSDYFDFLKPKTIIIENNYIDKDYLEDYTAYYVRCFVKYSKVCTRLHFFNFDFTEQQFNDFLEGKVTDLTQEKLEQNYLGFIVAKPLPQTIIGRTCLATYPEENDVRNYPILREYKINLFGLHLTVKSLAFQEQDHVVAACATSALWSVFQGTGKLFQHAILSPAKITEGATEKYLTVSRALPNNGLIIEQMVQAIKNTGLDTYHKSVYDKFIFKSTLYAYLKAGIPIILIIRIITELKKEVNKQFRVGNVLGKHAVAVTGYRLEDTEEIIYNGRQFKCKASGIKKVYVHDDQVGPFARMELDNEFIQIENSDEAYFSLSTSWLDNEKEYGNIRAIPESVLIPIYNKVRIPFEIIQNTVIHFNALLDSLIKNTLLPYNESMEWDIFLTQVSQLKNEILNSEVLSGEEKRKILVHSMPKYIWRATCYATENKILDLLFDATDIEQGPYFICAIEYEELTSKILHEISKLDILEAYKFTPPWKIIEWFRKN